MHIESYLSHGKRGHGHCYLLMYVSLSGCTRECFHSGGHLMTARA